MNSVLRAVGKDIEVFNQSLDKNVQTKEVRYSAELWVGDVSDEQIEQLTMLVFTNGSKEKVFVEESKIKHEQ